MRAIALIASTCLAVGCVGYAESEDDAVAKTEQPIQLFYVDGPGSTTKWVDLITDPTSVRAKATAAIRHSSGGLNYSCGATFISPHFAVTAAHCVDDVTSFTVQHINASNVTTAKLNAQAKVSGDWDGWYRGTTLEAADYSVTSFTCTVKAICAFGDTDTCPHGTTVDIATIECPTRPDNASWVEVASADNGTQNLEVWWFHEVLALPTGLNPDQLDRWLHYGQYPQSPNGLSWNYHYHYNPSADLPAQLLPLKSATWPDGTSYKGLGHANTFETKTNAAGCHGTSGSGVFGRNSTRLLGVVVTGPAFASTRLCADLQNSTPSTNNLNYIRRDWAAKMEAASYVQADR